MFFYMRALVLFFLNRKPGVKKQGFAFGNKRGNFLCLHMSVYPHMNDLERTSHIALRRLKSGLISFWRRVADSNMALVKEYRVAQGLENKEIIDLLKYQNTGTQDMVLSPI